MSAFINKLAEATLSDLNTKLYGDKEVIKAVIEAMAALFGGEKKATASAATKKPEEASTKKILGSKTAAAASEKKAPAYKVGDKVEFMSDGEWVGPYSIIALVENDITVSDDDGEEQAVTVEEDFSDIRHIKKAISKK